MLTGRAALAAIAAAGFLSGADLQPLALSPADETGVRKAAEGAPAKPAEGAPGRPAEGSPAKPAEKPAEESAPKPKVTEEGAPKSKLVSILGREVTNREGDGGRVIDVLVDVDGRSGAVVVEFGGFMGIGSRKVAVDWGALRFVREGNRTLLVVDISREQVRNAAEYKPNEPPTVLTTQKK